MSLGATVRDHLLSHRGAVAVAVSGGGDSMALLDLAATHAPPGLTVRAVTLDHGLRPEAAAEAAMVARFCAARGLPHMTLHWDWNRQGNVQAEARAARYRLIADWAREAGIGAVLLAHTSDDVAETFLIRLGRASGLDGLSRMASDFRREGLRWTRPLLAHEREELRNHLTLRGIPWVEDPSNTDDHYTRVKARQALAALAPLGITAATIARSATALRAARDTVDRLASSEWDRSVRLDRGDLILTPPPDSEIARRLLAAALRIVGGQGWPPRQSALQDLEARLARAGRHTLAGCLIRRQGGTIRIAREWQAVKTLAGPMDAEWDGRWRLQGPAAPGMEIRALGEGIRACDWRGTGLPRASLLAGPAVWHGNRLIAAPLAGFGADWTATLRPDYGSFRYSH